MENYQTIWKRMINFEATYFFLIIQFIFIIYQLLEIKYIALEFIMLLKIVL